VAVGVLVPLSPGEGPPPEALPLGRAALSLALEGVDVVFGAEARDGVLYGRRAVVGGWAPAEARVAAAYDRFPSQGRAEAHRALVAGLDGTPLANLPALVQLCRDKLATQRALEAADVRIPEVEADPARFAARLEEWGAAFVKPRHGAFGRGVRRVVAGEAVPAYVDGTFPGDEVLLQRAVPPPDGYAGVSARVLVQRAPTGWVVEEPVLRTSRTDPVVNAARGSEVAEAARLRPELLPALRVAGLEVAAALGADPYAVELGVDCVVDPEGRAWVVEVNGTPRGRLERLAAADPAGWLERHVQACARPLRYLAWRDGRPEW
jgi:glutathione synthase/RimK-type ligase-like ATP-grasp enzyme